MPFAIAHFLDGYTLSTTAKIHLQNKLTQSTLKALKISLGILNANCAFLSGAAHCGNLLIPREDYTADAQPIPAPDRKA
jgi:hypothetical protein